MARVEYCFEDPNHPRLIAGGAQSPGFGRETRLRVGPRSNFQSAWHKPQKK